MPDVAAGLLWPDVVLFSPALSPLVHMLEHGIDVSVVSVIEDALESCVYACLGVLVVAGLWRGWRNWCFSAVCAEMPLGHSSVFESECLFVIVPPVLFGLLEIVEAFVAASSIEPLFDVLLRDFWWDEAVRAESFSELSDLFLPDAVFGFYLDVAFLPHLADDCVPVVFGLE